MTLSAIPPFAIVGSIAVLLPLLLVVMQPTVIRTTLAAKKSRGPLTRWQDRVQDRFSRSGTFAYMFAWYKMRLDAMFSDLPELLKLVPPPRVGIDLGCGYGVAANTLLEWCDGLTIYGIDPDPVRVPAAAAAIGSRGTALLAGAPDFEVAGLPDRVDTIFCLDMIHFLTNEQLAVTFERLHRRLIGGGYFFLRSLVLPTGRGSLLWNVQVLNRKWFGGVAHHRSPEVIQAMLTVAGFSVVRSQPSTGNAELHWFIAKA